MRKGKAIFRLDVRSAYTKAQIAGQDPDTAAVATEQVLLEESTFAFVELRAHCLVGAEKCRERLRAAGHLDARHRRWRFDLRRRAARLPLQERYPKRYPEASPKARRRRCWVKFLVSVRNMARRPERKWALENQRLSLSIETQSALDRLWDVLRELRNLP